LHVKTLITGGGTGGHVYPALSIIQYLSQPDRPESTYSPDGNASNGSTPPQPGVLRSAPAERESETRASDDDQLVYVGNSRGLETSLVPRSGIRCYFFPMAPPSTVRGLILLAVGTVRSLLVMLRTRPRVAFATGGYVSVPVAIAARIMRIPLVLFLPDVVPGKAVAWLAPLARRIAASTSTAVPYLPSDKTVVTGYPVREWFREADRLSSRARFDLPEDAQVLFVFGGSLGARNINQAVAHHLPALLNSYFVLHVCGEKRLEEAERAADGVSPEMRRRYRLYPYLHDGDMAAALAAADLALCRSGASVLGELPAAGVPAILVPLPETAVHQRENADYLASAGAAVIVADGDLVERLLDVLDLTIARPATLRAMAAACRALDRPDAAQQIAALIEEVAA
jgi:UDP-N-acetylglucosamine--N-acetylmuramyl-(pentapeptide) pyrophosphoryl-undecaprenol N-acetylglucosamine transferase